MAALALHRIPSAKRAGEIAALLVSLHRDRKRAVVWVEDEERARLLDEFLWTFDKLSFLPHAVSTASADVADEPVVVVSTQENPNSATVLVVADGLPPLDWAAGFDEVHDLLPPGPAGDERRRFWADWPGTRTEEGA